MKRAIVIALLMIVLFTFVSLFASAAYLLWPLPGGMPFGNGLTATGLSSAAVVGLLLSKPGTILRRIAIISIVLSVLWLPISIGLAGNLNLNFAGANGLLWRRYTLVTFAFVLISMFWAIAQNLSVRWSGRTS